MQHSQHATGRRKLLLAALVISLGSAIVSGSSASGATPRPISARMANVGGPAVGSSGDTGFSGSQGVEARLLGTEVKGARDLVDHEAARAPQTKLGWSPAKKIDDNELADLVKWISCPTVAWCMAVDDGGYALIDSNGTWSNNDNAAGVVGQGPDVGNELLSVSCPKVAWCAAVDAEGNAFIYNSGTWSAYDGIDTTGGGVDLINIDSVSCPTTSWCMAVDAAGNALRFSTGTWGAPVHIDSKVTEGPTLNSVSCPTASFCIATDGIGNVLTYRSGSWSAPVNITGRVGLGAISCPTTRFCVTSDGDGKAYTYDGSSWSSVQVAGHPDLEQSISCPTTTFCAALAPFTSAYVYGDGLWSSGETLNVQYLELSAISCPAVTRCIVVAGDDEYVDARASTNTELSLRRAGSKDEVLSVKVSPVGTATKPTGEEVVAADGKTLCTIKLSSGTGSCTLVKDRLRAGTYHLVATFQPTAFFNASKSTQEILKIS